MRFILAVLLGIHGIAHFVGFVFSWRIATFSDLPYKTTIQAGGIDVGDVGIRATGLLWLLAGLAFLAAATGIAIQAPWALRLTTFMVAASLLLCLIGWPDSRVGLIVNVVIAALLLLNAHWSLVA